MHKAADAADAAEQQASKADGERKKKGCREVVTSAARSPAGSAVLTASCLPHDPRRHRGVQGRIALPPF